MARAAIHFMIAIWENPGAAWEAGIDQPRHGDHLAGNFLFGIRVGREIALHVTIRALDAKRLVEALHDEANFSVRREKFQVLWWVRWSRWSRPAATRLLSNQRDLRFHGALAQQRGRLRRCHELDQVTRHSLVLRNV